MGLTRGEAKNHFELAIGHVEVIYHQEGAGPVHAVLGFFTTQVLQNILVCILSNLGGTSQEATLLGTTNYSQIIKGIQQLG